MPAIEGDILTTVENAMRFRSARQGVLSMNIANADTPGYKRSDLSFDARLAQAALERANGRELSTSREGPLGVRRFVDSEAAARPDGNNVNPDREAVLLSRNAGSFVQQAEVLSRLIALRRTAVTGGR